jgi:heme-degrading monooxygenase HmoA
MMTVITRVKLRPGAEAEWDQAMRERLESTDGKPGWIRGQLLTPEDGRNGRVIVGTWESQANWKAWHEDETFQETRQRMDGLQEGPDEMEWFEVVTEGREAART